MTWFGWIVLGLYAFGIVMAFNPNEEKTTDRRALEVILNIMMAGLTLAIGTGHA